MSTITCLFVRIFNLVSVKSPDKLLNYFLPDPIKRELERKREGGREIQRERARYIYIYIYIWKERERVREGGSER